MRELPTLITPGGTPLRRPSLREVAQVAGLLRPLAREDQTEILSDLTIVGAGPAGLAAAVYAGSEGLNTVVLESYAPVDKRDPPRSSKISLDFRPESAAEI